MPVEFGSIKSRAAENVATGDPILYDYHDRVLRELIEHRYHSIREWERRESTIEAALLGDHFGKISRGMK